MNGNYYYYQKDDPSFHKSTTSNYFEDIEPFDVYFGTGRSGEGRNDPSQFYGNKQHGIVSFLQENYGKLFITAMMLSLIIFTAASSSTTSSHTAPTTSSLSFSDPATTTTTSSYNKLSFHSTLPSVPSFTHSIKIQSPGYSTTLPSAAYLPWDVIAEPGKIQLLSISLKDSDGESIALSENDLGITWTIDGSSYSGTTTKFQLDKTGIYQAQVQVYQHTKSHPKSSLKSGQFRIAAPRDEITGQDNRQEDSILGSPSVTLSFSFTIAVKHIRRELRSLSPHNRNALMSAMKILYSTDDSTGQKLYGTKYMSMDTFHQHYGNSMDKDCDHTNDGASTLVQRTALTLALEQSLQSIDPSLSLPYYESSAYDQSLLVKEGWFGSTNSTIATTCSELSQCYERDSLAEVNLSSSLFPFILLTLSLNS